MGGQIKTLDEMIAVAIQAEKGAPVQGSYNGEIWYDITKDNRTTAYVHYRIRPEPKRVPLGPEDVPPGSVVRVAHNRVNQHSWMTVLGAGQMGIQHGGVSGQTAFEVTWEDLQHGHEISRDGGKTWKPCWKEQV